MVKLVQKFNFTSTDGISCRHEVVFRLKCIELQIEKWKSILMPGETSFLFRFDVQFAIIRLWPIIPKKNRITWLLKWLNDYPPKYSQRYENCVSICVQMFISNVFLGYWKVGIQQIHWMLCSVTIVLCIKLNYRMNVVLSFTQFSHSGFFGSAVKMSAHMFVSFCDYATSPSLSLSFLKRVDSYYYYFVFALLLVYVQVSIRFLSKSMSVYTNTSLSRWCVCSSVYWIWRFSTAHYSFYIQYKNTECPLSRKQVKQRIVFFSSDNHNINRNFERIYRKTYSKTMVMNKKTR